MHHTASILFVSSCTCRMLQAARRVEALVISKLARNWRSREHQSDRPVATPSQPPTIGGQKYFRFLQEIVGLSADQILDSLRPARIPVKRRPNEPTRAQNSAAVPFVPAMCFTFSLFVSSHPFFFVLPPLFSLSLHSFILSLPELSTRGRRKTHNSDSPSLSSLSLRLSYFVFHAHLDLRRSQRSGVWPLSSSRKITDRCSSSVARALIRLTERAATSINLSSKLLC